MRDDIIGMAREAGLWPSVTDTFPEEVQHFAALVAAAERENTAINGIHSCHSECQRPICVAVREAVAAEREECAKICGKIADSVSYESRKSAMQCYEAIRERGAP